MEVPSWDLLLDAAARLGMKPADFWELTPAETERALRCGFYREAMLGHWIFAAMVGKAAPTVPMLVREAQVLWMEPEEADEPEQDPATRFRGLISGLPVGEN